MLVLTLKYGERVTLETKDGRVVLELGVAGVDRTKLAIEAPKSVIIQRANYRPKHKESAR